MRVGGSGVYEHETKSTTKVVVCFKRAGAGWSLIAHVHDVITFIQLEVRGEQRRGSGYT
jgi:hypothetical protein